MGQESHPHIALHGRVDGVRSSCRPQRRWLDNVEQDCKLRGKNYKISSKQAKGEIFCDEAAVARASIAKAINPSTHGVNEAL